LDRWPLRRWILVALLILIIGALALFVIRWQDTLSFLGNGIVSPDAPETADLILVLAGDFYGPRVLKGADLAEAGYAPVMLISGGPYQGRTEGDFAIDFLTAKGYSGVLFESFGHHAQSTIQEAIALRPELARRGVKRVLLVTSAYHSRRAAIVFRLFCPGIRFITIGAQAPEYIPDRWWTDRKSRREFYAEWSKIIGTILFVYPMERLEWMVHGK